MSAKEDVFEQMNPVLLDFVSSAPDWKQGWRTSKDPVASATVEGSARVVKTAGRTKREDETLQLVQRLFLAPAATPPKKVLFCGVDRNNSSEICADTGRTLATQTGKTVCLVDANLRDASLSKIFNLEPKKPCDGKLFAWREQCVYLGPNLFIAGSGLLAGADGQLISAREIKERLLALANSFDYLLFDAPCANASADTALLGQVAGSVVLVLEANKTKRVQARKAKERLEMATVKILGTVFDAC